MSRKVYPNKRGLDTIFPPPPGTSTRPAPPWQNPSMDENSQNPLSGVELEFPVTFDLRIIYVLAEGATIVADLRPSTPPRA